MKHNDRTLTNLWREHRANNPAEVVDMYIVDLLLEAHGVERLALHASALQYAFRRLEKEWQRVHKYDYAWAGKIAKKTGKPVAVFLNRETYEGAV